MAGQDRQVTQLYRPKDIVVIKTEYRSTTTTHLDFEKQIHIAQFNFETTKPTD